ncbi:MAG: DNA primase [Chitinophagaceae bacterium]|nr:DNA primase [Chitinophagaceae bacterium]
MISRNTIQKVNDTADILDVVGSFIKLKRRGANYLGNCPFHNEKTPSFTVSPSKGIYKCFGCGKAGNVITFIQEHEKLTYPETIVWLAKRYNIEVEETQVSQEVREQQQVEESLRIINQFAATYFHEQLLNHNEGQTIGLAYFEERGFRKDIINQFELGYCLEYDGFPEAAIAKGYQRELLLKTGLVTERQGRLVSMYQGRVIFPIHNASGKVIGFGARTLKTGERIPKYINTPENEVYHKSKSLYGIYFARTALSKYNECILVEGYTDVLSLFQSGVDNVVASSGTSLTEEQLKLISRHTKNLTILYDGDAAGIKAALRGLDMAIEQGMNVQVVLLPDNHDPDSYVRAHGAEGLRNYIQQHKQDIILFKLEVSLKDAHDDPIKKSALINDIAETLSRINKLEDFTKQDDYIRRCSELLKIDQAGLISLVNKKIREKVSKREGVDAREAEALAQQAEPEAPEQAPLLDLLRKDYAQEKNLLRVMLEFGNRPYSEAETVIEFILNKISSDDFVNPIWKNLFVLYVTEWANTLQYPDLSFFTNHTDEGIRSAAIEAVYFGYEVSHNWYDEHLIVVPSREDTFFNDVTRSVVYFMLRKIKAIYYEYLEELKTETDEEEIRITQQSILTLKQSELDLLAQLKVVAVR